MSCDAMQAARRLFEDGADIHARDNGGMSVVEPAATASRVAI